MRVVAALLATAIAVAAAPVNGAENGAEAVVRATLAQAQKVVASEETRNEKLDALREVASELLDTKAMGLGAIGGALDGRSTEDRNEYLALFDELIVRAYLGKLLLFREPEFLYGHAEQHGDATIVPTRIQSRKDQYFVNYELHEIDGRWLAKDVSVEGVSLTRNYRSQFQTILRHQSFEELLERMRRATRRLGEDGP